ncbi:hypothetical protein NB713_002361 [Xanthomonas sacchari]|nr:hypothetical protein [Xanthomonas sacchari]
MRDAVGLLVGGHVLAVRTDILDQRIERRSLRCARVSGFGTGGAAGGERQRQRQDTEQQGRRDEHANRGTRRPPTRYRHCAPERSDDACARMHRPIVHTFRPHAR